MIDHATEELTMRDRAIAAFILWRVWSHLLKSGDYDSLDTVGKIRDSLVFGCGVPPMNHDLWQAICDCYGWTNKQGRWSEGSND